MDWTANAEKLMELADSNTLTWPREGEVLVSTGIPLDKLRGRIDWCQGCDGLWKPWSMGWTDLGLYRCTECRTYTRR